MSDSSSIPPSKLLAGGCPIIHKQDATATNSVNPSNQMLIEEKQSPSVGQSKSLPTQRHMSSIPKGDFNPAHQEEGRI
jgi:hypothetical protein